MTPLTARASVALEWFRLFLVAQVALGHYAMIALPPIPALDPHRPDDLAIAAYRLATRFGPQAAYAFVFLSGYFLVPQLAAIARHRGTVAPFIARRLRRIYPTLVAAILLTLVCDFLGTRVFGAADVYRATMNYDAVAAMGIGRFLGNLASLQPTFVGAFGSNGPLWTLGYLVQFYIVGALLAAIAVRSRGLAGAATAALAVVAAWFRPEWLALAVVWGGAGAVRSLAAPGRGAALVLALGGGALFVAANLLPTLPGIFVAAGGTAGIVTGLRALHGDAALPGWAAAGARASFAIYAFHFPLAMLVFAAMRASGALALPGGPAGFIVLAALSAIVAAVGWDRAITSKAQPR